MRVCDEDVGAAFTVLLLSSLSGEKGSSLNDGERDGELLVIFRRPCCSPGLRLDLDVGTRSGGGGGGGGGALPLSLFLVSFCGAH